MEHLSTKQVKNLLTAYKKLGKLWKGKDTSIETEFQNAIVALELELQLRCDINFEGKIE